MSHEMNENEIDCKKCKGVPPRRNQPVCSACRGVGLVSVTINASGRKIVKPVVR